MRYVWRFTISFFIITSSEITRGLATGSSFQLELSVKGWGPFKDANGWAERLVITTETPPDERQNDPVTCKIEFLDTTGKPPLFRLSNHHTNDCGQPPAVDGDEPGKYFGYFANPHGEQTVFIYDYQTHEASVRMGDAGWGNAHRVVDGRGEGISLTESQTAWLRACWLAAAEGR